LDQTEADTSSLKRKIGVTGHRYTQYIIELLTTAEVNRNWTKRDSSSNHPLATNGYTLKKGQAGALEV
jgi:hypothetical protein